MNDRSAIRVLRANNYRRMPWKNGGGETVEIAVFPANAGLDDFAWRVSMASVASDGPFSSFPGIDRTLSILQGAGMMLTIGNEGPVTLTPGAQPFAFPADVATSAVLIKGPITDLNVMTRRGTCDHRVTRHEFDGKCQLETPGRGVRILVCQSPVTIACGDTGHYDMGADDALISEDGSLPVLIESSGLSVVYEIVLTYND
ncbi:HutD family protein [Thalassospira sp. MCCC 1A01428]|uniref:HutD/Ves family protein n=1 Tax=Thalassospira sp. MCCC 1A01428 TaxID=1470575 RepID=UPI001AEF6E48|nr:HutD family protein [Thalassospira sp. MCCC 1A01428]